MGCPYHPDRAETTAATPSAPRSPPRLAFGFFVENYASSPLGGARHERPHASE
ncbi:hypothetical protein HGI47_18595 [Novosphingobium sp. ERN07]|uniref:hypothetical protein n=1 Tax=Novosphingobium sp. ERN07 TaxID=2726187 RepID=UPI0014570E7B|nr:hypothetical protein [Novosphingobium sp. ERN07]NLR72889.1 hypothetical protein [Novosphingobium sp. ERN07]